ncbi:MAG: DNA double-strand break repair nuclease NurA [Candidatus Micrarchaeota archaeon]|nr:DNA double-strand break repair nuclease NurA [Candidatus Micrarchaeota archaeon]
MLDENELSKLLDLLESKHKIYSAYAQTLRSKKIFDTSILETEIANSVKQSIFSGLICAVDSGIYSEAFHGADVVVARTAAVLFSYDTNSLTSVSYLPSKFPKMKTFAKTGLDDHEVAIFKSLIRLREEISLAIESLEKKSPQVLLIDGSLLPLPSDRPDSGSLLMEEYNLLVALYKNLFTLAREKKCLLIGITKDSRGRRFVEMLENEECKLTCDSFFLDFLLNAGERTFTMKYSREHGKSSIMKDIGEDAGKISLFYLKTSEEDRPMRVEFLEGNTTFDSVASLIYSLSLINKSYTYPSVLIEVDMCAALGRNEVDNIQKSLAQRFNVLKSLKRNSRPFR